MTQKTFLVLDVGTTGTKAFLFSEHFEILHKVYQLTHKFFPQEHWVEQDPFELVEVSRNLIRKVVHEAGISPENIVSFGITNQRETSIVWSKKTGQPIYPAIVWEDERTEKECINLKNEFEKIVRAKTGLSILPYFSASKILWILEHVPQAKEFLEKQDLLFGTVDTWILWNLLEGQPHVTDITNASRTLLYNVQECSWDPELLNIFKIPQSVLPKVLPSRASFGSLKKEIFGREISVNAVCGDQQSSFFALPTKQVGTTKITYGTGTFVSQFLGKTFVEVPGTFTTLIPHENGNAYVMEAKVGAYGYEVKQHLNNAPQLEKIFDKMVLDVKKVIDALPHKPTKIFVDGGMTQSKYLMQKQQEVLGIPLEKQITFDGTALGIAKLLHSVI